MIPLKYDSSIKEITAIEMYKLRYIKVLSTVIRSRLLRFLIQTNQKEK